MLAGLFRETLSHGIVIAAQSEGDAERFRSIGANPAKSHVTGNIKFDFELPADIAARGAALRRQHAPARPMWVAGSTHEGEETAVLQAQKIVRAAGHDALVVIVPRHPSRFAEVAQSLAAAGERFVTRSSGAACSAQTNVLLVDTLGELIDFYAAADAAFVGGSLVPVGGHNLLEPAALGVPVLTGPHVFNAEDVAQRLIDENAAYVVTGAQQLGERIAELLSSESLRAERGAAGRLAVQRNRGALGRLLSLLGPVIDGARP